MTNINPTTPSNPQYDKIIGATKDGETVTGGDGKDFLYSQNKNKVTLQGQKGNDTVAAYGGTDNFALGGDGNDQTYAIGGQRNWAWGGAGDDISLVQDGTNNIAYGDTGNDQTYAVGGQGNWAWGGAGDDISLVQGGQGNIAYGDAGNDKTYAVEGKGNWAWGGAGNDLSVLSGGEGNVGYGDAGDDTLYALGGKNNFAWGGEGNDAITLQAGIGNTAYGADGKDNIFLNSGENLNAFGGLGDDAINITKYASLKGTINIDGKDPYLDYALKAETSIPVPTENNSLNLNDISGSSFLQYAKYDSSLNAVVYQQPNGAKLVIQNINDLKLQDQSLRYNSELKAFAPIVNNTGTNGPDKFTLNNKSTGEFKGLGGDDIFDYGSSPGTLNTKLDGGDGVDTFSVSGLKVSEALPALAKAGYSFTYNQTTKNFSLLTKDGQQIQAKNIEKISFSDLTLDLREAKDLNTLLSSLKSNGIQVAIEAGLPELPQIPTLPTTGTL